MTDYERIKAAIKELDEMPIMTQYLSKGAANSDSENDFACIACGSGTGENGTGAMHNHEDHLHCYSCDKTFKNHDIAAYLAGLPVGSAYHGNDFHRYAEKVFEMLGKSYDYEPPTNFSSSSNNNSRLALPVESLKEQEQPPKNHSKFYKFAQSQLPQFITEQGGSYRGLTLDDWQAVDAGIADNFRNAKCLILPYDDYTFFARSIKGEKFNVKQKNKGGKVQIYNPYRVFSSSEIIFITEGEIDCITINKFGYAAIATGGAGQISKIINQIEICATTTEKPLFIVMFDNNDKGAGQNNALKLVDGLKAKGFLAVNFILSPNDKYDANEFLQVNRAGLETRLAEIYAATLKEVEKLKEETILAKEQADAEIYGTGFSYYFKRKFYKSLNKGLKYAELDTGFRNLNDAQIFSSGLYVIGAPPSLGKTSFIWQLLEQIARQDSSIYKNHCIFCSYELSEDILFSKSLARAYHDKESNHFKDEIKYPLSSAHIRQRGGTDEYIFARFTDSLALVEEFEKTDCDLRVLDFSEGNRPNINKLIEKLKKIVTEIPENDRIFIGIDYLQLIPPADVKLDIRQAVDDTLHKLKDFCNKYNVVIFTVSSYNRGAYKVDADFSAFKESGTIEYHSDCLWSLQLFVGSKDRTAETLQEAKKKTPRQMELVTLKNRNGNDYRLFFKYYSAVDTFVECDKEDFEE
jgi:replicative DNA helicase